MKKILIIGLMLSIILLTGCNNTNESEKHVCDDTNGFNKDTCCMKCNELNYIYLIHKLGSPGMGRQPVNECFCHNGNNTIQIW